MSLGGAEGRLPIEWSVQGADAGRSSQGQPLEQGEAAAEPGHANVELDEVGNGRPQTVGQDGGGRGNGRRSSLVVDGRAVLGGGELVELETARRQGASEAEAGGQKAERGEAGEADAQGGPKEGGDVGREPRGERRGRGKGGETRGGGRGGRRGGRRGWVQLRRPCGGLGRGLVAVVVVVVAGGAVDLFAHEAGQHADDLPHHPGLGDAGGQDAAEQQFGQDLAEQRGQTLVVEVLGGQQDGEQAADEQLAVGGLVGGLVGLGLGGRGGGGGHGREGRQREQGVVDGTGVDGERQRDEAPLVRDSVG